MEAEATALAGCRVDLEIADGVETTYILADTALGALLLIDQSNLTDPEFVFLSGSWAQQQMQVSSIYITVGENLALSYSGEGTYYTCLSCAALAAGD